MTAQTRQLKGGPFLNRYIIKATLTARTPFHIGDGEIVTREGMIDQKTKKEHKINAVATEVAPDGNGKAYIPGSSLRGALRDWLCQGFMGMTEYLEDPSVKAKIEAIRNKTYPTQDKKDKAVVTEIINHSSALERIFGTQLNEGKLEVWDAPCTTAVSTPTDKDGQMCFWHHDRMTYVVKSVAIDPKTGTADEGKLYNYEAVPKGAQFAATFSAQNVTDEEAKLLLAVLNGFKHPDNPITIGAMTKLDFGRFEIDNLKIYRLDNTNIQKWQEKAAKEKETCAGYDLMIDDTLFLVSEEKQKEEKLNKDALPAANKTMAKHIETWTLKLETPMVVRSGSAAGWKNTASSKARNYKMVFKWNATSDELKAKVYDQVGDLYHSVEIQGNDKDIKPYYHVPSSSIRGSLRAWAVEHLLKKDNWNIETYLKSLDDHDLENKPDDLKRLEPILSLFGYAVEGASKKITEKYTKAGRLTIGVAPFNAKQEIPGVDGKDWKNPTGDNFGPANAARHIKPRNPLDRVTQAAKEGGLHNFLEFSEEQTLALTIEICRPEAFDYKLLDRWEAEINTGQIRFGGLTGIGRGRVKVTERKKRTIKEGNNG